MLDRCIEDIFSDLKKARELPLHPAGRKVKEGHIFDEDQSVKWNREKVKETNDEIDRKNKEAVELRYAAIHKADEELIDYIEESCGNRVLAAEIKEYCDEQSDDLDTVKDMVYRICSFIEQARRK